MILAIIALITGLAALWYWIRTLIVMSKENILWALGGFFIAPLVQIIFYLTQKENMDENDVSAFVRYFIAQVSLFVVVFLMTFLGAS